MSWLKQEVDLYEDQNKSISIEVNMKSYYILIQSSH
jgi:hypothetical protein